MTLATRERRHPGVSGSSVRYQPFRAYDVEQLWLPFSEILLDWGEAFHRLMLADHIRMSAYEKAIKQVVRPGDRVVDLGTGTGILSQWAVEAGADTVYGIELDSEILDVAIRRMYELGHGDRFVAINALSYDVRLEQRVDVLISEIMGNMADNEDFQPILHDAIQRFLVPGGRRIPLDACSYIVPVSASMAHRDLEREQVMTLDEDYDLDALLTDKGITSRYNLYYDAIIPERVYLSQPQLLRRYGEDWGQASEYVTALEFAIERSALMTGLKVHFIARLSEHQNLDISGDDVAGRTTSDSWKHAYLPIERPFRVIEGDRMRVQFSRSYPRARSGGKFRQIYRWCGTLVRHGTIVASFDQGMDAASPPGQP